MATQGCPCGYLGDSSGRCTAEQVSRYRMRLSGPLLDRIDMHIEVPRLPREALLAQGAQPCETSAQVRSRVVAAHARQLERCGRPNAQLGNRQVEKVCRYDQDAAHHRGDLLSPPGPHGQSVSRCVPAVSQERPAPSPQIAAVRRGPSAETSSSPRAGAGESKRTSGTCFAKQMCFLDVAPETR